MNDKKQAIGEKIITLIKEYIKSDHNTEIGINTPLITSGLLDSYNLIGFLPVLESQFNISFNIEELDFSNFEMPGSIAEVIIDNQLAGLPVESVL